MNIPLNNIDTIVCEQQLHTDCSILRDKLPAVLPVKFSMKIRGPDFFNQIIRKYDIITRSYRFPSLILLRSLEYAGGTTKLSNININNIKKLLNIGIRQYIDLYMTIQSGQDAHVPDIYNNPLSPERYVHKQVNIRTDHVKYTKHVAIPRLMRYLQQIDDQDSGYGYQPVSAKTPANTEFARTLPEKLVYQRKRSENTGQVNLRFRSDLLRLHNFTNHIQQERSPLGRFNSHHIFIKKILEKNAGNKTAIILSKNHDPESNIRVIMDTFRPVLAKTSQEKAQFQNSVDVMGYPPTHINENIPEIDAIMVHIQKRNKLVYEKHDAFLKRAAGCYLLAGKNNIANKLILNRHIVRSRVTNRETGEIPELLSHKNDVLLQYAGDSREGMVEPLKGLPNSITRKSYDLVLRKPAVHSAGVVPENTGKPDTIKIERTIIDTEKENIIGTNITSRDRIDNVSIIADRVYKLLETRISIEKERRGL
ncbi:MAG: hypothetical protein ACT6FG_03870 [Methanosarcinaceae archaeon]